MQWTVSFFWVEEVGLGSQRQQSQARLQVPSPNTGVELLTEVLCGDTVILSTGHSMDIRQHLIFGLDEFSFMGMDSVLGVGLAFPTRDRRGVQKAVLPDGVGPIAVQFLNHL